MKLFLKVLKQKKKISVKYLLLKMSNPMCFHTLYLASLSHKTSFGNIKLSILFSILGVFSAMCFYSITSEHRLQQF